MSHKAASPGRGFEAEGKMFNMWKAAMGQGSLSEALRQNDSERLSSHRAQQAHADV
jgi:hypothetical protein